MVQFNFTYDPSISVEQRVGFELAALVWSSYLTDDITVNLHIASSDRLGEDGQAVGGAIPIFHEQHYGIYQQYAEADATSELDADAVAHLQEGNTTDFLVDGQVVDGNTNILLTSAQAKALGMDEALTLDNGGTWDRDLVDTNALDGYILVSNAFEWNYDYTRSGDAPEGTLDFMSMALHEIGHQLGFVSGLDGALDLTQLYSGDTQAEGFTILDLFRHSDESGEIDNPDGAVGDLTRGQDSYFSVDGGETNLGNFSDGMDYQASHWERLRVAMGIMDPTLAYQERTSLGLLDLQAFDALGWDVNYAALNQSLDLDALLAQAEQSVAIDLGLASAMLTENRTGEESSISYELGYGELWKLFEQSMLNLGYGELWQAFELGYGELWQTYGKDIFSLGYGELWQLVEENIFNLGYGELWQQFETEMFELGYGELWQQFETEMLNLGYGELWQQFEQSMLALGYGELWQAFELGYGEFWQTYGNDLFKLGYGELWQLVEQNVFNLGYGELWQQFETEMFELGYGELWQQFETEMLQLGYGELWQKLGTFFATLDESNHNQAGQVLADGGVGGWETKIFYGGEDDDVIAGDDKQDRINAGAGDDLVDGKGGHDVIWGEAGRDLIYGEKGNDLLYGGDDDDLLLGETGEDELYGEAGHDILNGGEDHDILSGGAGRDDIKGGTGRDVLSGDEGNDRLDGEAGNDVVIGGEGRDQVNGGSGSDLLYGNSYLGEETLKQLRALLKQQPKETETSSSGETSETSNNNPIRIEIEDMTLSGDYSTQFFNALAVGAGTVTGTTTFTGPSGEYLVVTRYRDRNEDSGAEDYGQISFELNGALINTLSLDQNDNNHYTTTVSQNLTVTTGDTVSFEALGNGDEMYLDYIEFVPLDNLIVTELEPVSQPINPLLEAFQPDSSQTMIRVEAESMALVGDYSVASHSSSSGEQLIQLAEFSQGKALTTFDGETGFYDVVVGYYDLSTLEVSAQIDVLLNGVEVDTWQLTRPNNISGLSYTEENEFWSEYLSAGPEVASSDNFTTRTVASGIALSTDDVFELFSSADGTGGDGDVGTKVFIDYVDFIKVDAPVLETVVTSPTAEAAPNTAGLVAHWTFDETSGTLATDEMGTHDATLINTVNDDSQWRVGAVDGALILDGIDDYVAIADSSEINTSTHSKRTISVWFKADNVSIGDHKQILYEEGGGTRGLNIYLHNDQLYVGLWDVKHNSEWKKTFLSTDSIASGQWHHVALVLDGGTEPSNNAFKGYLDGELFSAGTGVELKKHAGNIGLGAINDGTYFHDGKVSGSTGLHAFAGSLDDAQVYNRALDTDEIATLVGTLVGRDNDLIQGGAGNDIAFGGDGNDIIYGESQQYVELSPEPGEDNGDILVGDAGNDTVYGQAGNDALYGDALSAALSEGLVTHWAFNEGSGSSFADTAGPIAENGFRWGGVAWIEDSQRGTAVQFDGENGGVTASFVDGDITRQLTLSTWVKADQFRDNSLLLSQRSSTEQAYGISLWGDGTIAFSANQGTSGGEGSGTWHSETQLSLDTWHHVLVTYDGEAIRFYIDGQLDSNVVYADLVFESNTNPFYIGDTISSGIVEVFDGALDDVRVYDRAISSAEAVTLATSDDNSGSALNVAKDASYYNGSYYLLSSDDLTWEEAQTQAESIGGNLVTINDSAEEAWLQTTFGASGELWIGLTDRFVEGQFEWVSGEAVTYTNWSPNEPNDFGTGEDYAIFNKSDNQQWDDRGQAGQIYQGIIEIQGIGADNLEGGVGNDLLVGGLGNDILDGSDVFAVGIFEKDTMLGGRGADVFVLGDAAQAYYQGEGDQDYALIKDFSVEDGDRLQLHGSTSSYTQQQQGRDLYLYRQGTTSDLVAILENNTTLDLNSVTISST